MSTALAPTAHRAPWKDRDEVFDRHGESIKAGTRVRIPAGTPIHGTFKAGHKTSGTSYSVLVDNVSPGYEDTSYAPGRPPEITWVGSGGYWHTCEALLVEALY